MDTKRVVVVAFFAVATVAVLWYRSTVYPARSEVPRPRLAVVTGGSGPYWQIVGNGARAAASDLDVDLDIQMPEADEDVTAQMKILTRLDMENLDGVALSPLDAEAQTRKITSLASQVFVVTVDSDAPHSTRLSYVGASNFAAGQVCAQLVREVVPEGGKIAVLLANLTKYNILERKRGLEEILAQEQISEPRQDNKPTPVFEIVGFLADHGDDQSCVSQLRELLADHDDLTAIVGLNARHGPILVRVLKDEGRLGQIKLITFDTPEETLAGIEAGHIYATVAQDPYQYGYEAIRLLASYCRRDKDQLPPPGLQSTMNISTDVVRQSDVDDFRKTWSWRLEGSAPHSKRGS